MTEQHDKEIEEQGAFVRPTEKYSLENYEEDTKHLNKLPYLDDEDQRVWEAASKTNPGYRQATCLLHGLKRITEQEARGMSYVGSLSRIIKLERTESWMYEGRSELRSVFLDKLEDLSNRPIPTNYSLDVKFDTDAREYFKRYMVFANFYRDQTAEGGEKSK